MQHLLQEVLELEHLVRYEAEDLLEAAVLLAGAGAEEDVVEEQVLHHRRHHPVDLAPRLVHEHRAELADLGLDSQCHDSSAVAGTTLAGRGRIAGGVRPELE